MGALFVQTLGVPNDGSTNLSGALSLQTLGAQFLQKIRRNWQSLVTQTRNTEKKSGDLTVAKCTDFTFQNAAFLDFEALHTGKDIKTSGAMES
jgi:hypothetical protein